MTYERKAVKRQARGHIWRHYVLLVVLCAVSIFLGTEFTGLVGNAQSWYDILTGQITRLEGVLDEDILELLPVKRFFAHNFGI